jgi:hypothetical protein
MFFEMIPTNLPDRNPYKLEDFEGNLAQSVVNIQEKGTKFWLENQRKLLLLIPS